MDGKGRGLSCKPNIYVSWFTSELRVRLGRGKTGLSPPVKYFYWPFQGSASFVDHLCYLCLGFVMLPRLFIAALCLPEGKELTPWLLFVMFIVILLLFHLVTWDRCGYLLYRFLILAVFLTLQQTACLVVNPMTVGNIAFLFNCTLVGRTSDSMAVPT